MLKMNHGVELEYKPEMPGVPAGLYHRLQIIRRLPLTPKHVILSGRLKSRTVDRAAPRAMAKPIRAAALFHARNVL